MNFLSSGRTRRHCHTCAPVFMSLCEKQWSTNGTARLDVVRGKDGVLPGYTMESGDHLTSPLGDFFSYSSKPPELFPSHTFLGFISFSFQRRSGLIKGGVRLLTCCVKMTGTQLPKRERGLRPSWLQSPVSGVGQLRFIHCLPTRIFYSVQLKHLASSFWQITI